MEIRMIQYRYKLEINMSEEILEKGKCVRCGKPSKNGGSGGRCASCLAKLKANRHKPGHYMRNQQQADSALRREAGKNGTASKKSSGKGNRKDIVDKMKRAESKAGQKLSPDRMDNGKGYASKNTRAVPEKLNRGRHKVDGKKLSEWRKRLKKAQCDMDDFLTLLKAKIIEKFS